MIEVSKSSPAGRTGLDLWTALWRQRLAAGLFLLGVVGYVVVYNLLAKPVWEAQTKLVYEQVSEPIPSLGMAEAFGRKSYLVNQIEEIKTYALAEQVARALPPAVADSLLSTTKSGSYDVRKSGSPAPMLPSSLAPERRFDLLVGLIMKSLSSEPIRDSDVILIKAQARYPGAAQVLAYTTAVVVKERNVAVKREQASSTRRFIEEQLPKVEGELHKNEEALMAFKAANQVVSLSDEAKELLVRTTQVGTEHAKARAERQAAEQRLSSIREQMKSQRASVVPSITTTTSAWSDTLRKKLVSQQVEYANLTVKGYTKDHPQMKKLAGEIERTKQQLTSEVLRVAMGESMENPMSRVADLSREALGLEIEIQTDSTREASLGAILAVYDRQMERLPNKELQLARLARSQAVNDNIYRLLLGKYEEIRIVEAGKIGNVRILDPARLPKSPVKPRKLLNLLMALIVGGVGATFLAAFLESLDKTLKTPEEVEEALGVPLVGLIPEIQTEEGQGSRGAGVQGGKEEDEVAAIAQRLVTQYVPRSPIAEAYRTLRTNLSFADLDKPLKTLVVTSPVAKEGKSTTVANLAITLAQMGVETLLIDTDLRRPVIDDLFQVKESPGLTDVLLGKASLETAIQKSQVEHLSILSTGALPPNPSELLASQKMGDLVAQAKGRFGMVLFDSPPVVAVTDAAVLSRWADAVLLVVRMSRTDRGLAVRAKELLENVRAKVVGTVMNDVKLEAGYGGYHYYYYYHYYGSQEKSRHRKK